MPYVFKVDFSRPTAFGFITFIFLLTTMLIPSSYREARLVIFLIWLVYGFANYRLVISLKGLCGAYLAYVCYSIFAFGWGVINLAPGAFELFRPFILWPILMFLACGYTNSHGKIKVIVQHMLVIEFIICFIDIWYCFWILKYIPWYPSLLLDIEMGFNFNPFMKVMRFSNQHICTHIFMVPFTIAYVCAEFKKKQIKFRYLLLILVELIATFLTGRIALWVTLPLVLMVLILLRVKVVGIRKITMSQLRTIMLFFMSIIAVFYFIRKKYSDLVDNIMVTILEKFINSFSYNDSADTVRQLQSDALLDGFWSSPLVGNGLGSYSAAVIRDAFRPWEYEMTYHYLLFSCGIIGIMLFAYFMWKILASLWGGYRNGILTYFESIPFMAGMMGILIASSMEGYLFKLGTMWMVFIPFGIGVFADGEKTG